MSEARSGMASVVERVRPVAAERPVVAIHFLDRTAVFVLGEECAILVDPDGNERRVGLHDGGILGSASDGKRMVTAGDDGKVVEVDRRGAPEILAVDDKRRWIDRVVLAPDGAVAWSAGKQAFARTRNGEVRSTDLPSSAGGLAFAPKGLRLAIAHYNGASLWFPNATAEPERLEWKGSHLAVTFSPDGKFLITAMQEPMLHGWRLDDGKHMRMAGYASKVRSLDWSAGGRWLATSGAEQLILWPFQSKDGPMGKSPRMLAPHSAGVTVVACHPKQDIVAVGYADGLVLMVRIDDGAEIIAKRPGAAPVAALAWFAAGETLAFGTEDGEAGLLSL